MKNMVKAFAIVAIICITGLGLLFAFGLMTSESMFANSGKILTGIGVLVVGAIAISAIGGGRNSTDETEPPPTL